MPLIEIGGGVDGIDGKDFAIVAIGEQGVLIFADMIGAAGHVAAEAGFFEVVVSKLDVGSDVGKPLIAREGPEGEGVAIGLGSLAIVDGFIGIFEGDAAACLESAVEKTIGGEPGTLCGVDDAVFGTAFRNHAADACFDVIPDEAATGARYVFEEVGLSGFFAALEDDGVVDGPGYQALGVVHEIGDLFIGEFADWSAGECEVNFLDRFDAEGDFVDDAAETVAGAKTGEEFGVIGFEKVGEIAGRRDVFDFW